MKKTLIVVLVVVSIAAFAVLHADTSPQVYGRLHLSLDHLGNQEDSALNLSSNSSRLGFKGEMYIMPGLSAIYQLEGTVNVDVRGGQIATRDSYGGINGEFGSIRLGYFDTPLKTIRSRTDFFGDQIGDARNMTLGNDYRFRNSIGYTSPKFGLVTLDAQYSVDQNNATTATDNDDWALSTSAFIREKDFYAGAAYEIRNDSDDSETAMRLGASIKLQAIRINAFFQHYSADHDAITIGGGAGYSMDDLMLKGQLYMVSMDGDDNNGILLALGADYKLSGNVRLLSAFAMTMNNDNAAFSSSGGGHGSTLIPVSGDNTMSISMGLRIDI
jgi:predicted porin